MTQAKLQKIARGKVRVKITRRKRRAKFMVHGPDGKIYEALTKKEAVNNLLARIRCWHVITWRIEAFK
jgi:hypothetical protein